MKSKLFKKSLFLSLFFASVFLASCNSNDIPIIEHSNIESLSLSYFGSTRLVEHSSIDLDIIVNGKIDNENKFVELFSSDESIVTFKNNTIIFNEVDENKEVTISAVDKDTKTTSSLTFTILDSEYSFNDYNIVDENYAKKGEFSIENDEFYINYNQRFSSAFMFTTNLKLENYNENESEYGITFSNDKVLNESSLLLSIVPSSTNFPYIKIDKYIESSNGFLTTIYKKKLSYNIDTSSYFNIGVIKFDDGFKVVLEQEGLIKDVLPLIELESIDLSSTYVGFYGKETKLYVKNSSYSYDFDAYIGRPKELNLDKSFDTALINDKYQIGYSLKGEYSTKNLKFSSSDNSIATVDDSGTVSTTSKGGNVKITIQYKGTNLIRIFSLNVYKSKSEMFVIDGNSNESFFKDEIGQNSYKFVGNEVNTEVIIYGFKGTFGLYFYAKQYITDLKNQGDSWWQKDNFEIRISTSTHVSPQYYCSVLNNGTSNIEHSYVTKLEKINSDEHDYVYYSEFYFPYTSLTQILKENVDSTTKLGLGIGVNDAYGWKCNEAFNTTNLSLLPEITEKGIK